MISAEAAPLIPGVIEAVRVGDRLDVRAEPQIAIANELYRRDPDLSDLTIERVGLEDAFVALIGKDK